MSTAPTSKSDEPPHSQAPNVMDAIEPYDPDDLDQLRRAWRIVMLAGVLGSCYLVFVAGAPRTGFLRALGFGPKEFGITTGLTSIAMLAQFFSGILATRLSRFRKTWTFILSAARLMVILLLASPIITANMPAALRVMIICGIIFCSDLLNQMSTPLWTAWMSELVPPDQINRQWAVRQRMTMIGSLSSMVIVALAFHWFETHNMVIGGFTIIATIGIVLGMTDITLHQWVPNPTKPISHLGGDSFGAVLRHSLGKLMEPIRNTRYRPFLRYMMLYMLAQAFATPFYGIFVLSELKLSIMELQLLNSLGTIAIIIFAQQLGFLCDKLGLRSMLTLSTILKFTTPLLFIIAPTGNHTIACIIVGILMFTDGVLGSAWVLATGGYVLKYTPRENRAMYVAASNILSWGLVMGLMPIVAGSMIELVQKWGPWNIGLYSFGGYHVSFLISIVLTLCTAGIAASVRDPGAVTVRELWHRIVDTKTWIAMRAATTLHESKDLQKRIAAAIRLGELHSPLGARELLRACDDSSPELRKAALHALEQIGSKTEITQELLSRALTHSKSREARITNIELIGRVGDATALVPLLSLWQDIARTDHEMRKAVASTLSRLSGGSGTQAVITMLDHEYDEATAAGKLPPPDQSREASLK